MKNTCLIALCALGFAQPVLAQTGAAAPQPARAATAQPQLPPPEALIVMIRSSLVALSHANLTNNYEVLSQLGSTGFRKANPPLQLAAAFKSFRDNRIDMNPVVFVTPQLTHQPAIQNGRLRLIGIFPTQPMQVRYDLQFEPEGGIWKLFGMNVALDRVAEPPVKPGR